MRPSRQPEPGQEPDGSPRPTAPSRPIAGMSDDQVLALYNPAPTNHAHDTMQRVIAERLTLAKQTIPHFYLRSIASSSTCSPRGSG